MFQHLIMNYRILNNKQVFKTNNLINNKILKNFNDKIKKLVFQLNENLQMKFN